MLKFIKTLIKILVPLLFIWGALSVAKSLVASKPPKKSNKPPAIIPTVEVLRIEKDSYAPEIETFGTIRGKYETVITPQVTGKITYVSKDFQVGQILTKGTPLVRVDKADYETLLSQARYNLGLAEEALAEELALSQEAGDEWIDSGRDIDTASAFVLRKPQLKAAQLNVEASQASVEKALNDLERTELKAPFDAIVLSRSASLGGLAVPQVELGSLVSTSSAEIQLPLDRDQRSRMLEFGTPSSEPLSITLSTPTLPDMTWEAQLKRSAPVIDQSNQTFYVIAEILNPYTAEKSPLSIGTFVNAKVPSKPMKDCFRIPESSIINNSFVWSITHSEIDEDKEEHLVLIKQPIEKIYSADSLAYVTLKDKEEVAELVIVSRPLTTFASGEEISVKENTASK